VKVPALPSPTVRRRRLAAELRRLRESTMQTGDDVAAKLKWSPSKISRLETAKTGAKISDVRKLLDLYGVTGPHRDELITLAREAERKGWWEAYSDALPADYAAFIGLEAEAVSAMNWESQVIPGLLQTADYARETIRSVQPIEIIPPSLVEARVAARLRRQEVLTRTSPLKLSVVMDESALLRNLGGKQVMIDQLHRIVEVAQLPNVTVQVLTLEGVHPVNSPPFILLRFGKVHDVTLHDVVYVEQLATGSCYEEPRDTYRYAIAYKELLGAALPPEESLGRISTIADRMQTLPTDAFGELSKITSQDPLGDDTLRLG
jgi:transcriptional regulator with XRE-family HTH domain